MSKNTVALRMLAYLKKEESYIKDFRKYLETQLFKLQIEELNLSSMLRNQLVRVEKKKQMDESEAEKAESFAQNSQVLSTAVGSPSASLEPLSLEPDLTMDYEEEEDDY